MDSAKNIAIDSGQYVITKESSDINFTFVNIVECVALVISLEDGRKFLYHRHFEDDSLSLKKALLRLNVGCDTIKSVKMYGGNLTSLLKPRTKTIVTFDGRRVADTRKLNLINSTKCWREVYSKPPADDIDHILSIEESRSFDREFDEQEKDGHAVYKRLKENSHNSHNYSFQISNKNEYVGYQNREMLLITLTNVFGQDITKKVTHQYTKPHMNLLVTKNGVVSASRPDEIQSSQELELSDNILKRHGSIEGFSTLVGIKQVRY